MTTHARAACLALALLLSAATMARADTPAALTVGIPDTPRPPYNMVIDGQERGIYADLLDEIAARTSLAFRFLKLPQRRHLRAFRRGRVQMEVGVTPEWRQHPDDAAVSSYSEPIMSIDEVVVFSPGRRFPFARRADAAGRTFCTVLGYTYPEQELFARFDLQNERELVGCMGREDGPGVASIIDRTAALHYARELGTSFDIGPPYQSTDIYIRVRRDRADILPSLDRAIVEIRADGTLDEILAFYTEAR